jgi:DUF971 family protein
MAKGKEIVMTAPTSLTLSADKKLLKVCFEGMGEAALSSELLRVESPSAEVRGHGAGQKRLVYGKKNVKILNILPVGQYAVKLVFDDGHDTGIYTWDFLQDMAENNMEMMGAYTDALKEHKLPRVMGCGEGCGCV